MTVLQGSLDGERVEPLGDHADWWGDFAAEYCTTPRRCLYYLVFQARCRGGQRVEDVARAIGKSRSRTAEICQQAVQDLQAFWRERNASAASETAA